MLIEKIKQTLTRLGQEQLLLGIEELSESQLKNFLAQIEKYDATLSLKQKQLLTEKHLGDLSQDTPFPNHEHSGNIEDRAAGHRLLCQGKVGCLILAGGQGTRLGVEGPKGSVCVSPIQGKSLFQIFCERTMAACLWSGQSLPLAIMTSPLNHDQTTAFFLSHEYFGLSPGQVDFFKQSMLPFTSDEGEWLLDEPGKLAEGPDGNGHALRLFFESGLWQKWKEQGVEIVNIIVVDNVLADPFDPELIGNAHRSGADVVLKALQRLPEDEKMGVIAQRNHKLKLIEYSELPASASQFTLSNTGLFCVSMEFIRHLYQQAPIDLPLHLARKSARIFMQTSQGGVRDQTFVWKYERFLFDIFEHARVAKVMVYPREETYAPLKNAVGDKSLDTVKQALYMHYRDLYHALTGVSPSIAEFELDPAFYYASEDLKRALAHHPLSTKSYISAKVGL